MSAVQVGNDSGLAHKTLTERLVSIQVFGQHFNGNQTIEPDMTRKIDSCHSAAANLFLYYVSG